MYTRIKYEFHAHIGYSKQYFTTKDKRSVRVIIDKKNMTFEIKDSNGELVVDGKAGKNYCYLLQKAKAALMKLGCNFSGEERDRDYGLPSTRKVDNE